MSLPRFLTMLNSQPDFSRWLAGPRRSPDAGGSTGGTSNPIRVLLVDDHEDTNRSLVLLLGRRGFQVRAATSLHEATQLAAEAPFDVLISDMSLPDGNGLELLTLLGDRQPACGAIVVSGYNGSEDVERSRAAGFKRHLSKPVEVSKLEEVIRQLVSGANAAS